MIKHEHGELENDVVLGMVQANKY